MLHTTVFTCDQCKEAITHESEISTGYGTNKEGEKICFKCCGINDSKELKELKNGEKMCLYLSNGMVINWPSTLQIKPYYTKNGRHNIAGTRQDVYFTHEGERFHGVQYGNMSDILHVKKIKS